MNEPSNVVGKELVVNNPSCEFIPLVNCSAVDGDTPFRHLIFTRFKIGNDFFGNFSEISAIDKVVCLEEDGSQPGLPNGIILEIELVESMEGISMSLQTLANVDFIISL